MRNIRRSQHTAPQVLNQLSKALLIVPTAFLQASQKIPEWLPEAQSTGILRHDLFKGEGSMPNLAFIATDSFSNDNLGNADLQPPGLTGMRQHTPGSAGAREVRREHSGIKDDDHMSSVTPHGPPGS